METSYHERLNGASVEVPDRNTVRLSLGEAPPVDLDRDEAAALAAAIKRACSHAKARA